MPPSSWHPIYELLTRHGVGSDVAMANAKNELRHWDLAEIKATLDRVQRPSRDYAYFRDQSIRNFQADVPSRRSRQSTSLAPHVRYISGPRAMIEQSAREEKALCINEQGQWSLRTSGYVALSHVWIDGLQRDKVHNGVSNQKVDAVFALLHSRNVQAEWIWTDVLVIPNGDEQSALDDEILLTDVINMMPQIYSCADAVIIIDAMVLQLHAHSDVDVAVVLACGNWGTRVWTYQEIKLANRALILTATRSYEYAAVVATLKALEGEMHSKYYGMWHRIRALMRDDSIEISIPDIVMSCGPRKSGTDVDYARAFFPTLGLKWEVGMTREEGMQKIYLSNKRGASRVVFFSGAPRMTIMPAWAPSAFDGLEGIVTGPMTWEDRGLRGDWHAVKIKKIEETFQNAGRFVFQLVVDCSGGPFMQCACARNEDSKVTHAFCTAVERSNTYVLSHEHSSEVATGEMARHGVLVERANVNEGDGFEAAVYCAVVITTRTQHNENKENILLRHWSPIADNDLTNHVKYMWHTQKGDSQSSALPLQEGESELHVAVRNGDLAKVIDLVEEGENIESFDNEGWTPLHRAAARDNGDILRHLLCQFPDKEIRGKKMNEDTPLSFAALNGQIDSVEILLEFGADLNARNNVDYTPIMVAANECHAEIVEMLLERDANPNDRSNITDESCLLLASGAGNWRLPTLKALIEGGADPKPAHKYAASPVYGVAEWGGGDEMTYLLAQGCEVDRAQWNRRTPLMTAILKDKRECVRLLLDAGADRNRCLEDGWRPIHYAAKSPNWYIMQMLLEKGDVELNAPVISTGRTALHIACDTVNLSTTNRTNHMIVVKTLLKAGPDETIKDNDGKTAAELLNPQESVASIAATGVRSPPPKPPRPTDRLAAPPPLPPRRSSENSPPPLPPRQAR